MPFLFLQCAICVPAGMGGGYLYVPVYVTGNPTQAFFGSLGLFLFLDFMYIAEACHGQKSGLLHQVENALGLWLTGEGVCIGAHFWYPG